MISRAVVIFYSGGGKLFHFTLIIIYKGFIAKINKQNTFL